MSRLRAAHLTQRPPPTQAAASCLQGPGAQTPDQRGGRHHHEEPAVPAGRAGAAHRGQSRVKLRRAALQPAALGVGAPWNVLLGLVPGSASELQPPCKGLDRE